MPGTMSFTPPVGLHNCDREPIHIPGSVQPHGALLAFDASRRLVVASRNAGAVLGLSDRPLPGRSLEQLALGDEIEGAFERVFDGVRPDDLNPVRARVRGQPVDVIMHHAGALLVAEFEPRAESSPPLDTFAVLAHRALAALQRRRQGERAVETLLGVAVTEVRRLIGFDRVMAYRFRPDGSGEVVAEEHAPDMPVYRGLRYPATDIPAQARRLYLLNPLRLIADVAAEPSPLISLDGQAALDQSHCTLRSVSPIHIEYLRNMGVGASMSVSIVVEGRLWGLIACHHLAAHTVPYTARMACLLIAQSLEMMVERAEHGERRVMIERSMGGIDGLTRRLESHDDLLAALNHEETLAVTEADGFAAVLDGRVVRVGATPDPEAIAALAAWLDSQGEALLATHHLSGVHPPAEAYAAVTSGLIAARFHEERSGYLLWFRRELRHVVRWGGKPEKIVDVGPHGPRLTPRGSFEEWQQSVVATADDWHPGHIELAETLRRRVVDAALRRATEVQRMRDLFIGILGHDLRNPVAAVSMAARIVSRASPRSGSMDRIGATLDSSSRRMSRLIDQMLDFSRIQAGEPMRVDRQATDLGALVDDLVDELALAYPGSQFVTRHTGDATVSLDPDRMGQVVSNLVGNARHHGATGRPIRIGVHGLAGRVHFEVFNEGRPIAPDRMKELFSPFKSSGRRDRRSSGVGLGLYITDQIVRAHGGRIEVESNEGGTTFRVVLPRPA